MQKYHCHGCGYFTEQSLEPEGYVCRRCQYQNNKPHECDAVGDDIYRFLVCRDCQEPVIKIAERM